ncbi:MAG TPA: UvrB/UvrC motif-containing protein, partial [Clostridia bacterium]|nr:UvrB/UvrC motif-containing protein [Clostridia bacterium]
EGRVIMYADTMTRSMEAAIGETRRRRELQLEFNRKNGITPKSIIKEVRGVIDNLVRDEDASYNKEPRKIKNLGQEIKRLEMLMERSAANLEFEAAARYRDEIRRLMKLKGGASL